MPTETRPVASVTCGTVSQFGWLRTRGGAPIGGTDRRVRGTIGVRPLVRNLPAAAALLAAVSMCAAQPPSDPAAWGSDHIGKPVPEYVTGDECLFCHRDIGPSWPDNPHQTTLRRASPPDPALAALAELAPESAEQTEFLLGAEKLIRFLRRSSAYGKLELLTAAYQPPGAELPAGQLVRERAPQWDTDLFADRCIGCHTTAVETDSRTFAATSLDCYACHGDVALEHSSDVSKVLLSRHPQDPLVANSICSSCHLRGGHSASSGLPYPNTFVPGDNLFRDWQIDLSAAAIDPLPPLQRHIYLNAREVSRGISTVTCVDCHSVHGNNSNQHTELADSTICASCHLPDTGNSELIGSIKMSSGPSAHNSTCDY